MIRSKPKNKAMLPRKTAALIPSGPSSGESSSSRSSEILRGRNASEKLAGGQRLIFVDTREGYTLK